MIKSKKQGLMVVISGPSGVGKGTIYRELLRRNIHLHSSISATTRKPRSGEQNGVEYYFFSKEEFEKKIRQDAFLEYATVHHGEYYGTLKEEVYQYLNLGEDVILEIDIQGAMNIKKQFLEGVFIFIMPPSMKVLKERLEGRNTETKEKVLERFQTAYTEINEMTKYNYVVVNDQLEESLQKIEAILMAERCRVDRIEDVFLDTPEEVLHEQLIIEKDFDI